MSNQGLIADLLAIGGGRPRIAMVTTHGYVSSSPPLGAADTGGQVVYVLELAKRLSHLGYEVDIWTRRFEDQPPIETVAPRVRILRSPCGGRKFIPKEYLCDHISEWVDNTLATIQTYGMQYSFLYSHYWDAGLAGVKLGTALGVRHLHSPHSLGAWKQRQMVNDYPGDAQRFEQQYNFANRIPSERAIYESADLILATTPDQLQLIVDDYGVTAEKCRSLPPGYDENRFFPISEASRSTIRSRLGYSGPVLLAIGRIARNKGYDLLLKAFTLVATREPDAILLLAIGGEGRNAAEETILAELRELTRSLDLTDRVRFLDFIPERMLADHYRAADAFVLPSRYEPFGMAAIEAMACGTPAVVTIHGGLYRALTFGRHALYADPFDPEDLGIMMLKVLRHPRLRARLARMGAHRVRSLFTWSGIAQQLLSMVEYSGQSLALADAEWDEPWHDAD